MSRAERLLALVQALRRRRRPVAGSELADELGVSLRTIYRDVQALIAQGAPIEGEAGIGYVLRPGFLLPPLMFTDDEIEALVLGARMAARRGDDRLATAADDALAKIAAVLPADLADRMEGDGLLVGFGRPERPDGVDLSALRAAIRNETKIAFAYVNERGEASRRVVWPIALAFFDRVRVLTAWCELRSDFRHFRTDRISEPTVLGQRYPRRRRALLKEWRELENIRLPGAGGAETACTPAETQPRRRAAG
ncbi:helix-turn-helix transcriptional regulator [Oharaeibacter diazotrophicus]|uniref:Putative DNA-binding transcriptional regulator YafY n=1 Tax=Oharaeibacter diazotrophicus TaxID=1920512 RepID=A0A4R6RC25_9HYPH|nr:YafY family protein [Oharaeibacter diazotrophicus]TDP83227.1 putative DNA-binding transcriptional regulator YafY [Oharaeibacter diazotrophicus]BBE72059.1 bifunctional ligase/repressor BirA [Pleomorphomonas sp. SM30]GLS78824.1 DeoR family transcriptional regulator [Oharaeibacter diazotrophicus]